MNITLLSIIAAMIGTVTAAVSAGAQTRIPSHAAKIPNNVPEDSNVKSADAVRVLNAYAACIVKRSRRGVERALSFAPSTPEFGPAMMKLMTDECLDSGELRFKMPLVRGAIFEHLYRADIKQLKLDNLKAAPAVDYRLGAAMPWSEATRLHLGLMDFADCVVRAFPDGAHKLVTSRIASPQETAAFAELKPSFDSCLTNGVELSFSKPILRGVVSEALYRLAAANAGFPMFPKKN